MSNFSPSLSSISRMKFSSLTSQAALLCKSDVNVYSVCLSLLFLIIIRIINPFHKHLPVIYLVCQRIFQKSFDFCTISHATFRC